MARVAAAQARVAVEQDDLREFYDELKDRLVLLQGQLNITDSSDDFCSKLAAFKRDVQCILPEDSKERKDLDAFIEQHEKGTEQKWSTSDKVTVGTGAVGVGGVLLGGLWSFFNQLQHQDKMGAKAALRKEALKLLDDGGEGNFSKALQKFKESGLKVQTSRSGTGEDCKALAEKVRATGHETSTSTQAAHDKANTADILGVFGAVVQCGTAFYALYNATRLRQEVMAHCSTTVEGADAQADAKCWAEVLASQKHALEGLLGDYDCFYAEFIAPLASAEASRNLDSDAVTPIWMQMQSFVSRAQSIVIRLQDLSLEVREKASELHANFFATATLTATSTVQFGVNVCQAIARPNWATVATAIIMGVAGVAAGSATVLNHWTCEKIKAFDLDVKTTLIGARAFLAKVVNTEGLTEKAIADFKTKQAAGKSAVQELAAAEEAAKLDALARVRELEEKLAALSAAAAAAAGAPQASVRET